MDMSTIAALFATATLLAAQERTGIRGSVVDVEGSSIERASLKLLGAESNVLIAQATSDRAGAFEVGPLKPGSYTLTARASGFRLRIWKSLMVREGEILDLGKLQLAIAGCDAPGVLCDTLGISAEPVFPGLIRQSELTVALNCGVDLVAGRTSCPADKKADFRAIKDGAAIYVEPFNGSSLDSTCRKQSEPRIRVDGFGPGLDFCVLRRDGKTSHVYVETEVTPSSPDFTIWLTTTSAKPK
jgi:hypothetical protein